MKNTVILLFFFLPLISFSQSNSNEFDPKKWEPPYSLEIPAGWEVERFPIPISFAPKILYKGVEDFRFAPGWSKQASTEYWSYAFLWYLDGKQNLTANIIETNLKEYYTGLIAVNKRDASINNFKDVRTLFKQVATQQGDVKTFNGSIYMLDYMSNKPISLYCKVHLRSCEGQNKTFIFYQLSPKDYTDKVWLSLDGLWTGFRCIK
ncbi:MAG: hypothetical protein RLY89_39 [Bacteroidota bacterium]|jgi:hypothetical protein